MSEFVFVGIIGGFVLAAGLLGLVLARVLPDSFTTGPARDMLSAVAGLMTLLCALVLGLLIWTAYGVYAGQNSALQTVAGKALQLDVALEDYGPDAAEAREKIKETFVKTVQEIESAQHSSTAFVASNLRSAIRNLEIRENLLAGLHPQTDAQKQALSQANAAVAAIGQTRLQMALALSNPVSFPLLYTVAAWVSLIFIGYGLTSRPHPMTIISVVFGAGAIASAFFMIVDMSVPYDGVFHVSPEPLVQALSIMGKNGPPS